MSIDDKVGIAEFGTSNIDSELISSIHNLLIVQIVSKGCFTLVTRYKENLDKIINEQKLQHSGLTSNALAVELGQLLNTQYIIIPNMTKIGKSYSFTAKLINVESGQIIRAASFINRLLEIDAYVEKCTRHIAAEICG